MDFSFGGVVFEWRGPAPHYFVRVPEDQCAAVAELAREVTYGWGMVPVVVTVGGSEWETSLWPKDGGYLVPLKARVRKAEALDAGDPVAVGLTVVPRNGRAAGGQGPTT